ncbi:hypothetical protein V8D89_004967 [Ganoderma adspersum]
MPATIKLSPSAFLATVPGPQPSFEGHDVLNERSSLEDIHSGRQLASIFKRSMESVLALVGTGSMKITDMGACKLAWDSHGRTGTVVELGFAFESPPEEGPSSAANYPHTHHRIAVPVEISFAVPLCDMDPGDLSFLQRDVLLHQHRLYLYRIVVQRTKARFVYLDHAGIRISDEFDWTIANSFLHVFVWKLAHMTTEELGFDSTAELATVAEICVLRNAINDGGLPSHIAEAANAAFDGHCLVYRLRITVADPLPDEAFPADPPVLLPPPDTPLGHHVPRVIPKGEHFFLVGRPHFQADRFVGRFTRGFVAFDLQAQRFCFVKDYWRPLAPHRPRPEHLVYERLHAAQTPFIATLICGGDVSGPRAQKTHVQDELPNDRVAPRVHYRIALAEVGMPLKMFYGFRELANVLAQAIAAHAHAVKYAGVLHGDVSVGNILIKSDRTALLIDWDHCRLVSELETGPCRPRHAGTWQFQSALSQRWPRKPYRPSDDIESFIHVFRYMVLRHHVTDTAELHTIVRSYFENSGFVSVVFEDGTSRTVKLGGDGKLAHFRCPTSAFTATRNPKLQALLDHIARRCYECYSTIDAGRMHDVYGLPQPVPDNRQEPQRSAPPPVQSLNLSWVTRSGLRIPPPPVSPSVTSTPAADSDSDPCDISGFLADPLEIIRTFLSYIASTGSQADQETDARSKAPDEFKRRDCERPPWLDPLVPCVPSHNRLVSLSELSTSSEKSSDSDSAGSASGLDPSP